MTKHHPPLDLVFDHAAGNLPEGPGLIVAAHLTLCGSCAALTRHLELVGGALLTQIDPVAISEHNMAATIHRAKSADICAPCAPTPPDSHTRSLLPAPLWDYVGQSVAALPWRGLTKDREEIELTVSDGDCRVSLLRLAPGYAAPLHTHGGLELTLVLDGGFTDRNMFFGRGDLSVADGAVTHAPVADTNGCLCFMAHEGPLKLAGTDNS